MTDVSTDAADAPGSSAGVPQGEPPLESEGGRKPGANTAGDNAPVEPSSTPQDAPGESAADKASDRPYSGDKPPVGGPADTGAQGTAPVDENHPNFLRAEVERLKAALSSKHDAAASPSTATPAGQRGTALPRTFVVGSDLTDAGLSPDESVLDRIAAAVNKTYEGLNVDANSLLVLNRDNLAAEAQARGFTNPVFQYPVTNPDGSQSQHVGYHVFPGTVLLVE